MNITDKFPGGNILVLDLQEHEVLLTQDLRDTEGDWFYWCFKAEGCAGKRVTFRFTSELVSRFGPGVSHDGIEWAYMPERITFDGKSFTYTFEQEEHAVYFAFSLPYQLQHFETFYAGLTARYPGQISREVFCRTEKGRPLPILKSGSGGQGDILITCRHHSCESVASYVLEGVIDESLALDALQSRYRFHILPFIDLDGVENGDQGKNRKPHDHNRDYNTDCPVYNVTKMLTAYAGTLQLKVTCDFHDPWKWGGINDHVSFVHPATHAEETKRFSAILQENTANDRIKHVAANDTLYGHGWNQGTTTNFSSFSIRCGASGALVLEVPYFGLDECMRVQALRRLGRRFTQSLAEYLLGEN